MAAFITRYCSIRQLTLKEAGSTLFTEPSLSLDDFSEQAFKHLGVQYPKFYKMDRTSRLGILSVEVLLRNIASDTFAPASVAVVVSNAHASLDTDRR